MKNNNESHFEYNENHADIFDTAASINPVYSAARGIGNALGSVFGGGGPDITQRQKDFATYSQAGFVKGGDPKDDNTWIFDLDWLANKANASKPWYNGYYNAIFNGGSPNAGKIKERWANYKAANTTTSAKPVSTPTSSPAPKNAPTFTAPSTSTTPNLASNSNVPVRQKKTGSDQTTQSQPLQVGASLLQSGASFTSSTWILVGLGGVLVVGILLYVAKK